jgi:hypothetical protein
MSALVFMDTETTGLSINDDIWEFAAIRREEDGTELEYHMFIEHDRAKCSVLPLSFRDDHYTRYRDHVEVTQAEAAQRIAGIFRNGKPHVVGAVPNFDTERIARLLSRAGYSSGWHYHLIDIENLAVGYIKGRASVLERGFVVPLPWNSDDLSRACGVEPPTAERHTAMGDARWAMALYDAIIGDES